MPGGKAVRDRARAALLGSFRWQAGHADLGRVTALICADERGPSDR